MEGREAPDLQAVAASVGLNRPLASRLRGETGRADLTQFADHIHLVIEAMDVPGPEPDDAETPVARDAETPVAREVDVVAGRNWVVTVHKGPVPALERIDELTEGETRFGALDAAAFVAVIVDEILAGYLALAEAIEQEIDQLDDRALRKRPDADVLARIVAIRRRIGAIRGTLNPHRHAFAPLIRPDIELIGELGRPWPGLYEQLDRAIDAIENLRDRLLGTYDIYMGRAAQNANEVMKRLTLLSAILLPSVVLAGVMGMNFQMDFFDNTTYFWVVVGAMVLFGVTLFAVARWRRWL